MRKGVTPVVATVLLMAITIGAAGTLYTAVESNIGEAQQETPDLPLNVDSLSVEQCYQQGGRTILVIRNGADQAINATKMTLLLNGSIAPEDDYEIDGEVVNPQRIFEVNMTGFGSETTIQMTNGQNTFEYVCYNL